MKGKNNAITSKFNKEEDGGFWVSFPDIPECLTRGDDISAAYEMAVDALGPALEDERKDCSKPIKKTLSIQEWLNEEAIRNEINFSAVLQEALKRELGII